MADDFLSSTFSNPWVALPWAIGSGIASAYAPRTIGRGLSAANSVLATGIALEDANRRKKQQERLSDTLKPIFNATTDRQVTKTGLDPSTEFSLPESIQMASLQPGEEGSISDVDVTGMESGLEPSARLSDYGREGNPLAAPGALPTYKATEQVPVYSENIRNLGNALLQAGAGEDAMKLATGLITREPNKPQIFGGSKEGHFAISPSGEVVRLTQGTGEEKSPTYHYVQTPTGLTRIANTPGAQPEKIPGVQGRPEARESNIPSSTGALTAELSSLRSGGEVPQYLQARGITDPKVASGILIDALKMARQEKIDERTALAQVVASVSAANKKTEGVKNPSDWMRFNEELNDVETAPTDISAEELKKGGYREIKNLKDRQSILASGLGLDLQFQKVQALADEYKNTSAISLLAGQYSGGQVGSAVGATMEGTGRQMIQFLEKELGGVRAAGSKPLLDAASSFLLPRAIDSNELIDLKMQGLKVLVDGLKDAPRRAAFGKGINPTVKAETEKFIEMVKAQAAKERGEKPTAGTRATPGEKPAPPRKANPQTRYDELKKSGMADADIYKQMAKEGF
jgi:hypothetical protein